MKIATRIGLSFSITAVIITTVALSIVYLFVKDKLKEEINAHLATAAKSRACHVVSFLENYRDKIELLASDVLLKNTLRTINDNNPDVAENVRVANVELTITELKEALEAVEHGSEIFVFDPYGQIVMSTEENSIGIGRYPRAHARGT